MYPPITKSWPRFTRHLTQEPVRFPEAHTCCPCVFRWCLPTLARAPQTVELIFLSLMTTRDLSRPLRSISKVPSGLDPSSATDRRCSSQFATPPQGNSAADWNLGARCHWLRPILHQQLFPPAPARPRCGQTVYWKIFSSARTAWDHFATSPQGRNIHQVLFSSVEKSFLFSSFDTFNFTSHAQAFGREPNARFHRDWSDNRRDICRSWVSFASINRD